MDDSEIHLQINKRNPNSTNPFDQLPHETLFEILSRLPIKSLLQFTFTCKAQIPLSHDPHLINLHLSRADGLYLIVHSVYPLRNQLHFLRFFDQKVGKFDTPFAQSMPEFSIVGSSNGLLCLIDSLLHERICIYNPFTRDYFELPKNRDFLDQVVVHGFGFDPVGHNYKVVKIMYYKHAYGNREFQTQGSVDSSKVKVYSKRSNAWMDKGIVPYRLEKWSSPGVLVSQRLHWVSLWAKQDKGPLGRVIVSYDLVDDTFHTITKPDCSSSSSSLERCHLAALDGCLCATVPVASGHGFNIWVMKEYGVDESWVKEYSIGVYYPVSMISHELERSHHIWRNMFGKKRVKVLSVLESGEVVLEYTGGGLVAYDPRSKIFKELAYEGMPRIYKTTLHVGSLMPAAFS